MIKYLLVLSFLFSATAASAKKKKQHREVNLSGVVEKCHDGDTCRVLVGGKIAKVRFAGIDTPELKQEYGHEAQRFTENLVKGKNVDLKCDGASWDRITCTVFIGGANINREIVQGGWAYDSTKFSKGAYKPDETEAKSKRLGMWRTSDLTSPYCFRHKTNKKCLYQKDYMP